MPLIILQVPYAMIREPCLPNWPAKFQTKRESSLDELHGSLQRNIVGGCKQCVKMIGHDYEFVKEEFVFVAIMRQGFNEEIGGRFAAEDRLALRRDGGDKEDAIGIHSCMLARPRCGSM